ncbi:hypothetical protein CPB84DRAFT_117917 [Gymnopilus junonius]|uniref:Sensitive to high expression protein 9, mitochondrial n=1 Tax=Gymnopilus junonius TaxID=109634 RepID=A0A9P5NWR2_GYMJU|nr:hypothetical protein CPB84DRAFT_117917 [Gymnopilus junonius]
MLRSSLTRPLRRRPFSTCAATRNAQRPPIGNDTQQSKGAPSSSHSSEDLSPPKAEESTPLDPLPQSTESTANPFILASPTSSTEPQPREPLSAYDLDLVKRRIREWTEQATIALRNRADDFTESTKVTFSQLGSQLNRVTGYEEIEALKRGVVEQGMCGFIFIIICSWIQREIIHRGTNIHRSSSCSGC